MTNANSFVHDGFFGLEGMLFEMASTPIYQIHFLLL
jgi:hypothetical protein